MDEIFETTEKDLVINEMIRKINELESRVKRLENDTGDSPLEITTDNGRKYVWYENVETE